LLVSQQARLETGLHSRLSLHSLLDSGLQLCENAPVSASGPDQSGQPLPT